MRADSEAARFIAQALAAEDFTLVDVGCSGGIDPVWSAFEPSLRVYGFDISETAIRQLQAADANPKAAYIAGRVVTAPDRREAYARAAALLQRRNPWERLAAHRTQERRDDPLAPALDWTSIGSRYDPLAAAAPPPEPASVPEGAADDGLLEHNLWHRTRLAKDEIFLPAFFEETGAASIDFIKIDVDGPDYGILESLAPLMDSRRVLGVGVEVNFIGTDAADQHTFHNTDRLMRRLGFTLFGLTVRRYSSAALPFMYADRHPFAHKGTGGRPLQGDALYVRDFGFEETAPFARDYSDDKLLKLAALFALAGLSDQAAEVLLQFRPRLEGRLDVERALDLLTREVQQEQGGVSTAEEMGRSYCDYMAGFESDSPRHYGSEARWWAWREDLWAKSHRLADAEAELADARAELDAMRRSKIWRAAAALRRLIGRR